MALSLFTPPQRLACSTMESMETSDPNVVQIASPQEEPQMCPLGGQEQVPWHAPPDRVHPQQNVENQLYQDPTEQSVIFFQDTFRCPVKDCLKVFSTTRSYRLHRVKYHRLPRFACIVCSEPFEEYTSLTAHMEQEYHLIQCIMCERKFRRPCLALSHFNLTHKLFRCLHCSLPFSGKFAYKNHIQEIHAAEERALLASSCVETNLEASFSESGGIDLTEDEVEVVQDVCAGDVTVTSPIDVEEESNQLLDHLHCSEVGTATSPIDVEEESNSVSECTCSSEELPVEVMDESNSILYSQDPGVGLESINLAANPCFASDTAVAQLPCDTDSPPESGNEMDVCGANTQYLLTNEEADSSGVMFGPGAKELLEDRSHQSALSVSSSKRPENLATQWIGHNVHAFQSVSDDYRKTFRYICGKCSHSFKSKDLLKKHSRTHEHVCKHCFLRFDTLVAYKSHLKTHYSTQKTFLCSVCSHSLQGLKSLMVHEMRHRLDLALRRKVEEAAEAWVSPKRGGAYQCQVCNELFESFSLVVRHEVWHDWNNVWTSYVVGRIFQGTFKEDDTVKLRNAVEKELIVKWRDCLSQGKARKLGSQRIALDDTHDASNESLKDNDVNDKFALHKAQINSKSDSDDECETTEGAQIAVNNWMSYWCSYLGLDKSPPSWVKPILKTIRLQWRGYNADDSEEMYKKMDQIAFLVRAEKNEISGLDSPKVVVERLHPSAFAQKVSLPVLKFKNCIRKRYSQINIMTDSCGMLQNKKPGPSSRKRIRSMKNSKSKSNERKHSTSITSGLEHGADATPAVAKACEATVLAQELPQNVSTPSSSAGPIKQIEPVKILPVPSKQMKFNDENKSPVPGLLEVMRSTRASKQKENSSTLQVCSPSTELVKNTCSQVSPKNVDSEEQSTTVGSSITEKRCLLGLERPLIVLQKLDFDAGKSGIAAKMVSSSIATSASTKLPMELAFPSSLLQMHAWIKKEIHDKEIPSWAMPLITCISDNLTLSPRDKVNRLHQIAHLIKVASGDSNSSKLLPIVSLQHFN